MTATERAERAGLLADILAHKQDDTPRLVMADWLDEHGEGERAEFIRVQVERYTLEQKTGLWMDESIPGQLINAMKVREQKFMNNPVNWWGWLADLYQLLGTHAIADLDRCSDDAPHGVRFRRGFVAEARCPLAAWLERGPAVVKEHPVERVAATDKRPSPPLPGSRRRVGVRTLGDYWAWYRGRPNVVYDDPNDDSRDVLPESLWCLLGGSAEESGRWKVYTDEKAALDALSDALLSLAEGAVR